MGAAAGSRAARQRHCRHMPATHRCCAATWAAAAASPAPLHPPTPLQHPLVQHHVERPHQHRGVAEHHPALLQQPAAIAVVRVGAAPLRQALRGPAQQRVEGEPRHNQAQQQPAGGEEARGARRSVEAATRAVQAGAGGSRRWRCWGPAQGTLGAAAAMGGTVTVRVRGGLRPSKERGAGRASPGSLPRLLHELHRFAMLLLVFQILRAAQVAQKPRENQQHGRGAPLTSRQQ